MIGGRAMKNVSRLPTNAGIAIGPILFIIAILGILAAAIAAGSGSFTTGTNTESNRTKAAAIIEIGQNLKVGFDRIVGNGTAFASVDINASNTSDTDMLFSPTGGGIAAPSTTMAATPASDSWMYPLVDMTNLGTGTGNRLAVLKVTAGVCDEINNKANSTVITSTPGGTIGAAVALGNFSGATLIDDSATWPLPGKPTGCVNNSNGTTGGYYFYQVIGIQ